MFHLYQSIPNISYLYNSSGQNVIVVNESDHQTKVVDSQDLESSSSGFIEDCSDEEDVQESEDVKMVTDVSKPWFQHHEIHFVPTIAPEDLKNFITCIVLASGSGVPSSALNGNYRLTNISK